MEKVLKQHFEDIELLYFFASRNQHIERDCHHQDVPTTPLGTF
jgi:hypothetical protein